VSDDWVKKVNNNPFGPQDVIEETKEVSFEPEVIYLHPKLAEFIFSEGFQEYLKSLDKKEDS
jgi:hypothetical protein